MVRRGSDGALDELAACSRRESPTSRERGRLTQRRRQQPTRRQRAGGGGGGGRAGGGWWRPRRRTGSDGRSRWMRPRSPSSARARTADDAGLRDRRQAQQDDAWAGRSDLHGEGRWLDDRDRDDPRHERTAVTSKAVWAMDGEYLVQSTTQAGRDGGAPTRGRRTSKKG
jgi:hypothetical protein